MTLGELIKEYREKNGISQRRFAYMCGLSNGYISMLERNCNPNTNEPPVPSITAMKAVAGAIGITLDELLSRIDDTPLDITENPFKRQVRRIPVFGNVAAGVPIDAITDIEDYEEMWEDEASRYGELFALRIKGDSMEPRICNGDIVIVRAQPDVENGETAIVCINGDQATCKKVQKTQDGLMLISTNPKYDPMFFSWKQVEDLPITVIGKVIELRSKF